MSSFVESGSYPHVALLLSSTLQHELFSPEALEQLARYARIDRLDDSIPMDVQLPRLLQNATACLTGWDTPPFSEELLAAAPHLQLLAHTGGSVHFLHPEALFNHNIHISHANAALAEGVAEFTILAALLCLRRAWVFDQHLKAGHLWDREAGGLLRTQRFGLVSVGSIGCEVVARLKPFGCTVLAYDPYLSPARAADLGVELMDLDTLFATTDIVSLHTPLLPATRGMIGARQLALLRDGAILLNTARAGLVDEAALLRELSTGRFVAALDVFHQEPLPLDSPLRGLPNVFLSPHIAALTAETLLLQGQMMVDEVQRFLQNEPLQYEVTAEMLSKMA